MGYGIAVLREVATADYESSGALGVDEVEALGDEIVVMAAHVHAGTHRMLALLARFDAARGWEPSGQRSCAHWLSFRTGLDLGTAREHVRVARALVELPVTSAAMERGELSFSQVRALTRVASSEDEADLVDLATGCTTAYLERLVRAWKRCGRKEEADLERERHRSRGFAVFPDGEGMDLVKGRVDPEAGAVLRRAVEGAMDALYRERGPLGEGRREASRRRADALGLVAERALAAGFGPGAEEEDVSAETRDADVSAGTRDATHDDGSAEARDAAGCTCSGAPISGSRAERYQVMLHVEAETLEADGEPGLSELDDGTRVSAETSRRLACDAGLVRVTRGRGENGSQADETRPVLDVGRRTRTIPPALRRALEVRDRGCRFPGCGLRFTEAHHVVHWADGGETSLANTVLLCRYHHRLVHEEGWTVEWWPGGKVGFLDPRGTEHFAAGWRELATGGGAGYAQGGEPGLAPARADLVEALMRQNLRRGTSPTGWTPSAQWKREADIPERILFRGLEAGMRRPARE